MGGFVRDIFGGGSEERAAESQVESNQAAIAAQERALSTIREDLRPTRELGTRNIPGLENLVANLDAQEAFLEESPILSHAQNQIGRSVLANRAARGKLGSGGTLDELQSRFVANALPILNQQQSQLSNLVNLGSNAAAQTGTATQQTAGNVSNLLTSIGDATAAGIIGKKNARVSAIDQATQAAGNAATLIALSDRRLKKDLKFLYRMPNGINVYEFSYLNNRGRHIGVIAQEVESIIPDAVIEHYNVKFVDYSRI